MFSAILLLLFGFAVGMYLTNAKFRHVIDIPLLKMLYAICWSIEQVEDRWGEIQPVAAKPKVAVDKVPPKAQTLPSVQSKPTAMQIWRSAQNEKVPHVENEKSLEQLLKDNPDLDVEPKA